MNPKRCLLAFRQVGVQHKHNKQDTTNRVSVPPDRWMAPQTWSNFVVKLPGLFPGHQLSRQLRTFEEVLRTRRRRNCERTNCVLTPAMDAEFGETAPKPFPIIV